MHKFIDYICDELDELEKKAEKGKLSMTELQYADTLAHLKKNLLTADAMMESEDEGYSGDYSYARGRGRNARRDSMGRYSREGGDYSRSYDGGGRSYGYSREEAKEDMMSQLHKMERNAHDDESRRMVQKWIRQAEEQ